MDQVTQALLAKLEQLDQRYIEIDRLISQSDIVSNPQKLIPLTKEQGKLRPMVERYRKLKELMRQTEDSRAMADDRTADPELRDMARDEVRGLIEQSEAMLESIKNTLVMADDDAIDSVILEIRAGTGGEEASLFARDLHNMYTRYADRMGWKVETMDFSTTDKGGFREIVLTVSGPGVWSHLGYESGGHRVQRVPETESQGRVHTSAATVAVLPEPEEVDMDIKPEDVIENVSCAGGPGGQNVNKVASAIRLEHIPTGIVVSMRDERSQHKNRAKAWRILRGRIFDYYQKKAVADRSEKRKTMIGSGDRSERIRTYNFPQNRLTDHRINLSLYSLEKIMMGEIDDLIKALKDYDKQQRLENMTL
jgi:peptide chain release factor 1